MSKIHPKQIVLYTDPDFILSSDILIPSVKATKGYVNTKIQELTNSSEFHTTLASGQLTYDVTHNMNNNFLIANVWTGTAGTAGTIIPVEKIYPQVLIIDENTVRVNFNSATEEDTILVLVSKYVNLENPINYVDTDIEITDSTKGIILRSANNTRFRITVDNNGALITTML